MVENAVYGVVELIPYKVEAYFNANQIMLKLMLM